MRTILLALIAAPVSYILAGFAGALIPGATAVVPGAPTEEIGLARGPIHYDILLPLTPDTRAAFGFAEDAGLPMRHPQAEWLVVGWGSEAFYTTVGSYADMTPGVLWQAATGDAAVLRLDLAGEVSGIADIDWLEVSPAQITRLLEGVLAALERDSAGQPMALPPAPWGQGHVFYRATGQFNIFHTCNVWAGEMLRAAGISFGLWTPTMQAVRLSQWWNHA